MKEQSISLLTFALNDNLFAIPLQQVNKVIRSVAVTPVPDADPLMHGVFDFHGEILPVINLRRRFSMDLKNISVNDRFLIITTPERKLAFVVDRVEDIKIVTESDIKELFVTTSEKQGKTKNAPGLKQSYFLSDKKGIIIIYDLDKLINSEMKIQLDKLMEKQQK